MVLLRNEKFGTKADIRVTISVEKKKGVYHSRAGKLTISRQVTMAFCQPYDKASARNIKVREP